MSTLVEKFKAESQSYQEKSNYKLNALVDKWIWHGMARGLEKASEIVKQHKCTWQGTFSKAEETIHYTLSCGNKYFDNCLGADVECFKYCPFCGGEIEFSEVQP